MFQNREEAGKLLTKKLGSYRNDIYALVLAIPRGGVVVGGVVAHELNLPFSLLVVKKLGAPSNPELAIGAVAPSGIKVIDWDLALRIGVEQDYLDKEIKRKQKEVEERVKEFMVHGSRFMVKDKKIVILVDDGVATGATVLAGIKYIKEVSGVRGQGSEIEKEEKVKPETYNLKPKIILAVPVIARDTYDKLQSEVDRIVALEVTTAFGAVGEFYREFPQVTDEEVVKIITNKYQ